MGTLLAWRTASRARCSTRCMPKGAVAQVSEPRCSRSAVHSSCSVALVHLGAVAVAAAVAAVDVGDASVARRSCLAYPLT